MHEENDLWYSVAQMREIIRFILDIFAPEPLLVSGAEGFFSAPRDEKPKRSLAEIVGLSINKGAGGFLGTQLFAGHSGGGTPNTPPPPKISIPPAPVTPIPPPPTSSQSIYSSAQAAREAGAQQASGFGFQASLLSLPPSAKSVSGTGPNGTINTATGTGSLLGLK